MTTRHLLFVNGELEYSPDLRGEISTEDYIVGVDGGTRHIFALGLAPHVVIGDLDSIDAKTLSLLRTRGIPTLEHPVKKDFTDLELALEHSMSRKASEIVVVSALGGRLDHLLANTFVLGSTQLRGVRAQLYDGKTRAQLLQAAVRYRFSGVAGRVFSLLPLSADVKVRFLEGSEWTLRDESLPFGSSRGISNVFRAPEIEIELESGSLLMVTTVRA